MKKIICIVLTALLLFSTVNFTVAGQAPRKVIFCCDAGYMNDDTLALSILLRLEEREEVEILGIALSGGNNFIDAVYTSAYGPQQSSWQSLTDFLRCIGREDIPVYKGTDYPLGYTADNIADLETVHRTFVSENGEAADRIIINDRFGALWHFHDFEGTLTDDSAAMDFIVEQINAYPNEISIVVVGPTTDLARAILQDSSIAEKAEGLYMMGGTFGTPEKSDGSDTLSIPGANTTNYAEYNALFDPEALSIVLKAGFGRLVITPATCHEPVPEDLGSALAEAAGDHANALMKSWIEYHTTTYQDYPYWDPMAVYAMLCPDKITEAETGYATDITDPDSEFYGESILITDEEYSALPAEEAAAYGKVTIVQAMEGFWDYVIPLLAE